MVGVLSLWFPILVAAALVFLASSIIHMALPYHKGDHKKVPEEDAVMESLRDFDIPPGDYALPRPEGMEEMKSEAFKEKARKGPVLFMTVLPRKDEPFAMGGQLAQWFLYSVIVGVFAAYIAGRALGPGAEQYRSVFRLAGCTAFVGYSLAHMQRSIWYGQAWSTTAKNMFDGLVYGLITGGTFGWMWPEM